MTVADLRKVLELLPDDAVVRLSANTNDWSWNETDAAVYTVREAYTSQTYPERNKPAVIILG